MKWLYKRLMCKRAEAVRKVEAELSCYATREQRERFQTEKFNEVWRDAYENIPFYGAWKKKYSLPNAISDLGELIHWPILTKIELHNIEQFKRKNEPWPNGYILTGGSSGVPVRMPTWGDKSAGVSQWLGRAVYGVRPGDRTFLLWGHEHLYGKGFRRVKNIWMRRLKDWLAGWIRVSAYDLGIPAMKRAYDTFVKFQPSFFIGYSPSVLTFCRVNASHAGEVKSVKVVLCSAGPLTKEEKSEIEAFFGARVCMEYGSMECGIMAYTRPEDGKYHTFWNTHLLQACADEHGELRNIVTRLTRNYIPLIRYDIGDCLALEGELADNARSVFSLLDVKGRPSEFLNFKCGVSLFAWGIGDCVKQSHKVINHQLLADEQTNQLLIRVVAASKMDGSDFALIRDRIQRIIENVGKIKIRFDQVQTLAHAPSGKTPRLIRCSLS